MIFIVDTFMYISFIIVGAMLLKELVSNNKERYILIVVGSIVCWNINRITEIKTCSWKMDETLKFNVDTFEDQDKKVILKG